MPRRPQTMRPETMRPDRVRISDELGRTRTLTSGPGAFVRLRAGRQRLVLGLGPEPKNAPGAGEQAWYLECPDFAAGMPPGWAPPEQWHALSPEADDLLAAARDAGLDLASAEIQLYAQGLKLFPSFWGPVLARLQAVLSPSGPIRTRQVLLPGRKDNLILPELERAFAAVGWEAQRVDAKQLAESAPSLLRDGTPGLVFCLNFQGLDPLGQTYHHLRRAGAVVAAWCVDNPWHLLSGLKAAFWRDMPLFVTDASFVPALKAHGASRVFHLPLATDTGIFCPQFTAEAEPNLADRVVFAGRSAFPAKAGFFADLRLPPDLWAEAQALARGGRPDFAWWLNELGITSCWPDKDVRLAGFGAEESGRFLAAETLRALAAELPLTVYGDDGWRELLSGSVDLRPSVDYYGALGRIYSGAGLVVNRTSPLLPAGLTQRHFDVWAAGGLLLSDATPGLELFPSDLTAPMVFHSPAEAPVMARRLLASDCRELARQWRDLILSEHSYRHRVEFILETLGQ